METILTILNFLVLAVIVLVLLCALWPVLVAVLVVGLLYLFWPLSGLLLLVGLIAAVLYASYWG